VGVHLSLAALGLELPSFVDGHLVTDDAADCCAGEGVMVCNMAGDRTHHRTGNAAGVGRAGQQ
jgi:hypothetical protein